MPITVCYPIFSTSNATQEMTTIWVDGGVGHSLLISSPDQEECSRFFGFGANHQTSLATWNALTAGIEWPEGQNPEAEVVAATVNFPLPDDMRSEVILDPLPPVRFWKFTNLTTNQWLSYNSAIPEDAVVQRITFYVQAYWQGPLAPVYFAPCVLDITGGPHYPKPDGTWTIDVNDHTWEEVTYVQQTGWDTLVYSFDTGPTNEPWTAADANNLNLGFAIPWVGVYVSGSCAVVEYEDGPITATFPPTGSVLPPPPPPPIWRTWPPVDGSFTPPTTPPGPPPPAPPPVIPPTPPNETETAIRLFPYLTPVRRFRTRGPKDRQVWNSGLENLQYSCEVSEQRVDTLRATLPILADEVYGNGTTANTCLLNLICQVAALAAIERLEER